MHWPGLEISETARVKLEFLYCSDHVSSRANLNAPLGQLLEPILSSETHDVKLELEQKSNRLGISVIGENDNVVVFYYSTCASDI